MTSRPWGFHVTDYVPHNSRQVQALSRSRSIIESPQTSSQLHDTDNALRHPHCSVELNVQESQGSFKLCAATQCTQIHLNGKISKRRDQVIVNSLVLYPVIGSLRFQIIRGGESSGLLLSFGSFDCFFAISMALLQTSLFCYFWLVPTIPAGLADA